MKRRGVWLFLMALAAGAGAIYWMKRRDAASAAPTEVDDLAWGTPAAGQQPSADVLREQMRRQLQAAAEEYFEVQRQMTAAEHRGDGAASAAAMRRLHELQAQRADAERQYSTIFGGA